MLKTLPVHMLWISGNLSRLARLSLTSFLAHGYRVTLWSYDGSALQNCGAELRDAAEIAPLEGCFAALTSLFRYNVMATHGGVWSDMDIVALTDGPDIPALPLVASAKRRPFRHREASATGEALTQVSNCFMANPQPRDGDLWQRATSSVESIVPQERTWENVGPYLLTRLMLDQPDHGVRILPPDTVDPIAWWNVPAYFLEQRDPPSSPFMHLYASIWAKRGVDAEAPFPENSLVERLGRTYGV